MMRPSMIVGGLRGGSSPTTSLSTTITGPRRWLAKRIARFSIRRSQSLRATARVGGSYHMLISPSAPTISQWRDITAPVHEVLRALEARGIA